MVRKQNIELLKKLIIPELIALSKRKFILKISNLLFTTRNKFRLMIQKSNETRPFRKVQTAT